MLAFEQLVAAEEINRPMFCGGHEPGARLIRDAGYRPLLERGDESVLRKFFGDANVAHDPRETGDELRLLDPEDRLDCAMCVGRRHDDRSHHRQSLAASRRRAGVAASRRPANEPYAGGPNSMIWRSSVSPSQPGQCCL